MKQYAMCFLMGLAACSMVPEYQAPVVEAPSQWRGEVAQADVIDAAWWSRFGHVPLEEAVKLSLVQNLDLTAALQRIERARAEAKIAGADLYPSVGASGDVARDYNDPSRGASTSQSSYRMGASVSYEVDLWGRNRASLSSAEAQLQATEYDRDALALIVASDVALTYAEIMALNQRQQVAKEQLAAIRDVMRIVEVRFKEGMADALQVAQQRTVLASIDANLAELERQRISAVNRLAVLLGEAPQTAVPPDAVLSLVTVPEVAPLQPAALLARRPDLRREEAGLRAANADIGVARAALFPSVSIGLSAGLAANPASAAASTAAGLIASIFAPLFQGGRLEGGVEASEARKAELVELYRKAVLVAFQESEDALAATRSARERLAAYEIAVTEARNAYRLAREQFDAGRIDFLTLLDTQRSQLSAEDEFIRARLEAVAAAVQLYKAMGGGWQEKAEAPPV